MFFSLSVLIFKEKTFFSNRLISRYNYGNDRIVVNEHELTKKLAYDRITQMFSSVFKDFHP